MKRFTRLFAALDETTRTNEKVAALADYFREAEPADAAWALHFLYGRKVPRAVTTPMLRELAGEEAGVPAWLFEECYSVVGDLAETVALLLPKSKAMCSLPLHEVITQRLLPMRGASDVERRELLVRTWRELGTAERLVWNKLITGGFRVGVAQSLVIRALAGIAEISPAAMAHRLLGRWQPTGADFERLIGVADEGVGDIARPYPFFLASPLQAEPASLGDVAAWQCEWKWDGIRAQIIRRGGETLVWSRGEDLVTSAFPEVETAADTLLDGTVLDGEIVAWSEGGPGGFGSLQRRLGRKTVSTRTRAAFPVIFIAYDLLEHEGADVRVLPLSERRERLEEIVRDASQRARSKAGDKVGETPELFPGPEAAPSDFALQLSEVLHPADWTDLSESRKESRSRGVEGIMLKRRDSPYGTGRQRGDWWKWKIDPLVIDAVMISAQSGHGRRANLYTDYTFAVWDQGKLVPVAKAYSGLSDAEIGEVDAFVRAHTTQRFGPIRAVEPVLVFELAFEGVQESSRHKSGVAVRFPRIHRWRRDKAPEQADSLVSLVALGKSGPKS